MERLFASVIPGSGSSSISNVISWMTCRNLQLESYEKNAVFRALWGRNSGFEALNIRDNGWKNENEPEVVGASEHVVESPEEAMILLECGSLRRVTASTAMNRNSSPNYAILSVVIEQTLAITNTIFWQAK